MLSDRVPNVLLFKEEKQPFHPTAVQKPFQTLELNIMDLPATKQGNKHVVVFHHQVINVFGSTKQ